MTASLEAFFDRDAVTVARELIGAELQVGRAGGIVTETEAYRDDDPASHSYRGQTPRNAAMFGRPGTAYVYRSYGLHWCLNAVCRPGSAVLLRAIEPRWGLDLMIGRRGVKELRKLASGPGRLAQALGVDAGLNGWSLSDPPFALRLSPGQDIVSGIRIGISQARHEPWRFGLAGSAFLSRPFRNHQP
jgi:DNA-3-methyladenine glycosylase